MNKSASTKHVALLIGLLTVVYMVVVGVRIAWFPSEVVTPETERVLYQARALTHDVAVVEQPPMLVYGTYWLMQVVGVRGKLIMLIAQALFAGAVAVVAWLTYKAGWNISTIALGMAGMLLTGPRATHPEYVWLWVLLAGAVAMYHLKQLKWKAVWWLAITVVLGAYGVFGVFTWWGHVYIITLVFMAAIMIGVLQREELLHRFVCITLVWSLFVLPHTLVTNPPEELKQTAVERASTYIAERTTIGDTILTALPAVAYRTNTVLFDGRVLDERFHKENKLLDTIKANPPQYMVQDPYTNSVIRSRSNKGTNKFIQRNYTKVTSFGAISILEYTGNVAEEATEETAVEATSENIEQNTVEQPEDNTSN